MPVRDMSPRAFLLPGMGFQEGSGLLLREWEWETVPVDEDWVGVIRAVLVRFEVVRLWLVDHVVDFGYSVCGEVFDCCGQVEARLRLLGREDPEVIFVVLGGDIKLDGSNYRARSFIPRAPRMRRK